jgi:histidinol dehydrogenase
MPDRRQGPGSESDHRSGREDGFIVYPVYSRRSGGVSVGINLFPDRKLCSFDCPYCEVFPFETPRRFSLPAMERELRESLAELRSRGLQVRDLCFSGNGEPTMSPDFTAALDAAARIRDELVPASSLVVITNGSTLADSALAAALADAAASRAAGGFGLDIWLKVDAGTEAGTAASTGARFLRCARGALTAFVAAFRSRCRRCSAPSVGPVRTRRKPPRG